MIAHFLRGRDFEVGFQIHKQYLILQSARFVMSQKKSAKRGRRSRRTHDVDVETEAIRALRTVSDKEAFYFYEDIGKPTGASAKNLTDFLQKTESVKLESLLFHFQRKDFQNWIKNTLGDSELARKIGRIRASNNDDLRTKIHCTVENRMRKLQEACIGLSVNENLILTSSELTR
jgi:hypothetical protein